MKLFIGTPGSGKTKELIEAAAKVNGVIVCDNVDRMINKIHAYDYVGIDIVSYYDFISNKMWEDGRKYFVKKAEDLLSAMSVESFTLTTE